MRGLEGVMRWSHLRGLEGLSSGPTLAPGLIGTRAAPLWLCARGRTPRCMTLAEISPSNARFGRNSAWLNRDLHSCELLALAFRYDQQRNAVLPAEAQLGGIEECGTGDRARPAFCGFSNARGHGPHRRGAVIWSHGESQLRCRPPPTVGCQLREYAKPCLLTWSDRDSR